MYEYIPDWMQTLASRIADDPLLWVADSIILASPTGEIQRLRRAAKKLRAYPWRDSQMRADLLLDLTAHALMRRGAWTMRQTRSN